MKTLDTLILEQLADHPHVTAKELAALFGEDVTRCRERLEQCRKSGLCYHDGKVIYTWGSGVNEATYTGFEGPIRGILSLGIPVKLKDFSQAS